MIWQQILTITAVPETRPFLWKLCVRRLIANHWRALSSVFSIVPIQSPSKLFPILVLALKYFYWYLFLINFCKKRLQVSISLPLFYLPWINAELLRIFYGTDKTTDGFWYLWWLYFVNGFVRNFCYQFCLAPIGVFIWKLLTIDGGVRLKLYRTKSRRRLLLFKQMT